MVQQDVKEIATLGGGCFWCLEAIYKDVPGVEKVESGYSGGTYDNPTYEEVCTGNTGHAEVVQLTFNPKKVSFRKILEIFFKIHDPTQLNRQGGDVGPQYRSIILYHSLKQKEKAERIIDELEKSKTWNSPIVTEMKPFKTFYRAENYHQNYFENNPNQPYCQFVILPKIMKYQKAILQKDIDI